MSDSPFSREAWQRMQTLDSPTSRKFNTAFGVFPLTPIGAVTAPAFLTLVFQLVLLWQALQPSTCLVVSVAGPIALIDGAAVPAVKVAPTFFTKPAVV